MTTLEQSLEDAIGEHPTGELVLHRPASWIEWIERSIEHFPGRAFIGLSIFYFIVVVTLSSLKLLWLDELITLHIAGLNNATAIWHALERGVDPNPPATYLLVHASRAIFGKHELADRLPAAVGYWVGILSLFLYLKRRVPGTWALGGAMLSMAMGAFQYSFESRSYGIFYGLAMLAFLCWINAVDPARSSAGRLAALVGMIAALAAGVSTNYFAILAFFPVAMGETIRTIRRSWELSRIERTPWGAAGFWRAIEWRIWIAFVVAASPLFAYRPLIQHSIAQFAPYAWNKVSLGQVVDSYTEMVEMILYPILALFFVGFSVRLLAPQLERSCADCRERLVPAWIRRLCTSSLASFSLPPEEVAAVFMFIAYPFLGYFMASICGGMLSPRFVIPVCFGFAIASAFIAFRLFRGYRHAGLLFLSLMTVWFICRESYVGYQYEEQKQCFYKIVDRLPQADLEMPRGAPIVIPDPLLALTFEHYAPWEYVQRVVFPVDFPAIRFYRHDDSPEENLWAGRGFIYTLPIVPLADFQNKAGKYLIITGDFNWLLEDLRRHSYNVERLPIVTRADAMGGFTPLARGTPDFYTATGKQADFDPSIIPSAPVPFHAADDLPNATHLPDTGGSP